MQLITCGVGAKWAGLSDTSDRLRRVGFSTSFQGEKLIRGVDEYIRYYARDARMFKLATKPAIHLDARIFSDPANLGLARGPGRADTTVHPRHTQLYTCNLEVRYFCIAQNLAQNFSGPLLLDG